MEENKEIIESVDTENAKDLGYSHLYMIVGYVLKWVAVAFFLVAMVLATDYDTYTESFIFAVTAVVLVSIGEVIHIVQGEKIKDSTYVEPPEMTLYNMETGDQMVVGQYNVLKIPTGWLYEHSETREVTFVKNIY